ncbi:MAG: acVLRF1 family peptidyl-tRNA hydrolase [Mycobacteriales bacterium]
MSRWVDVDPQRLARWFDGFGARHGDVTWDGDRAIAQDGCVAVHSGHAQHGWTVPDRRRGLLLVRLGGYAVGVAQGPVLVASKVGQRPVHGRSAAGGWSQQRFARRREGQVKVALAAAADTAARLLLPESIEEIVSGGDRSAVAGVLADPRLAPLRRLVTAELLEVPDPRLVVLQAALARVCRVRIEIRDGPNCLEPSRPSAGGPTGR